MKYFIGVSGLKVSDNVAKSSFKSNYTNHFNSHPQSCIIDLVYSFFKKLLCTEFSLLSKMLHQHSSRLDLDWKSTVKQ